MAELTPSHHSTSSQNLSQSQVSPELINQLGESGAAVLYLAAQMAAAPIQEQLLCWVFEQTGQSVAAQSGLSACEASQVAQQVEPGIWEFDTEVASHMALSLTEEEQDEAVKLKHEAVQFFNLAVDGHINAPLIATDLDHIRYLTAQVSNEAECDLLIWLADFAYQNGDSVTSAQSWQSIYHYLERTFGEEHENTLTAMNNLAENLRALGDLDDALELYQQQLTISSRTMAESDSAMLAAMQNMASVLRQSGDLLAARDTELKVLEQRKASQGEDHPDTLMCVNNFASTLKALGEIDQALALQREVLAKQKILHPVEDPQVTEAAWNLIQTYLTQSDYDAMQDVLFDDLFWLMDDNAVIQSQSQLQVKDMLKELLNQQG